MSHEWEKSADNGRFLLADKNRVISCHVRKKILADFLAVA